MKVKEICSWLDALAPFETAEGFDNVGLLMGDGEREVRRILFGMDVTEALVREAVSIKAELIIAHHPFIFHALKRIDYAGPQGRALCMLAENRICVIGAHTNWDKAPGGVGDSLAAALKLSDVISADDYVRIGRASSPMTPAELQAHVRRCLHADVRVYPASDKPLRLIAAAGGAYGEGYLAALSSGAEAYVVGEIAHHEIIDAHARGITICDAGHYPTEWPGVRALYERFIADAAAFGWKADAHLHSMPPYAGAMLAL